MKRATPNKFINFNYFLAMGGHFSRCFSDYKQVSTCSVITLTSQEREGILWDMRGIYSGFYFVVLIVVLCFKQSIVIAFTTYSSLTLVTQAFKHVSLYGHVCLFIYCLKLQNWSQECLQVASMFFFKFRHIFPLQWHL